MSQASIESLYCHLTKIISETNGISLRDTLVLCLSDSSLEKNNRQLINEFIEKLNDFQANKIKLDILISHPVAKALFLFFKNFPLSFSEEHIHLTGSLNADFIFEKIMPLLTGPHGLVYEAKLKEVYGDEYQGIKNKNDVQKLIQLASGDEFARYLKILYLPKLVLINREAHKDAAYHMAEELFTKFNVGKIRLKFTLSRASTTSDEQIPGIDQITEEDVVLGLFEGFMAFKKTHPTFEFILSPCFRKEAFFYDGVNFKNKQEHFNHQVKALLEIIEKYPELKDRLCEVDTVGDEKELYRKTHFNDMKQGFRKLQYRGFAIRSHHGETWQTLKKGVQAVDNAMNIWRIDTLEHGLSLGINPNFYFHQIYQSIIEANNLGSPIKLGTQNYRELLDMDWQNYTEIRDKIIDGIKLNNAEGRKFLKIKFHTAREVESYQHDVLNRMIQKNMNLVALPTSNKRLTGSFRDFKDHPFSWWEKKGVRLGIGTDNYITLNTNYINELLIMLCTDANELKITKILMIATGETRRPYISQLLWTMRNKLFSEEI